MSSLVWHQPGLATLMGMSMSDNKPTNASEIKKASEAAAATLTSRPQTSMAGMRSGVPELPEDYEAAFVDDRKISETRNAQLKRLLSSTWLRLVLIAAAVTLVLIFILLFRSLTEEKPLMLDGSQASSSVEVNKKITGKDSLNAQQAEYLMEKRRQEAAERATAGQSSAAFIELPRATVGQGNMAEQSEVSFDPVDVRNRYNQRENSAAMGANPTGEARLDLSNTGRYRAAGGYYIDKESNTMVMTPEIEAQMRAQAEAEMAASDNRARGNATYNTSQQNSGNQGQYNSNDGNNGAGNNNGGGDNGAGTGAEQQVQQREPDAELPLIQQRLYNEYDRQVQEQAEYQRQLEAQRESNRAAAEASQRERSRLAQQSLGDQLREMERRRQGTSGFSTKPYIPAKPQSDTNSGQAPQNPIQAQPNDFVRSAYTTNTMSTEPVKGESSARPGLLPNNIIRAGTSWPVVVTKSVNTDEGLQIIAQVMDGPFTGSEVYGIVQQTGRDIGVSFTRIVPPNPRKPIIPVNAMALTIGSQKQAVSSDRKNHYLQNYTVMAAESAIEGYGDAYSDQNTSTIIQSDGTVITSKGKTTRKEVQGNILSQFADRLNNDVSKLGNRAPTYYVRQGAVLQMKLLTNLDRNQVASDIGGSTQGQGQL